MISGTFPNSNWESLFYSCNARPPIAACRALKAYLNLKYTFGKLPLEELHVWEVAIMIIRKMSVKRWEKINPIAADQTKLSRYQCESEILHLQSL